MKVAPRGAGNGRRPRIAIDCDGVLLSWQRGFSRHVQDVTGLRLTDADFDCEDCLDYPTFRRAGLDPGAIESVLNSYFHSRHAYLEDDAAVSVWSWLTRWADVHVLTNRPPGCLAQKHLAAAGIDARFEHNSGPKQGTDVLVDDWASHCRSYQASGGHSILYEQPWSGPADGIDRVSDWHALAMRLQALHPEAPPYEVPT